MIKSFCNRNVDVDITANAPLYNTDIQKKDFQQRFQPTLYFSTTGNYISNNFFSGPESQQQQHEEINAFKNHNKQLLCT